MGAITKGKEIHESWVIDWKDVLFLKPSNINEQRTFLISQDDYLESARRRLAHLLNIVEAVQENKPFIMNVYRCVDRQKIESYLNKLTYQLIADVVEEKCAGMQLAEEHKEFIAGFYKYGFVGVMLDWIDRGMKDDYHKIVEELAITLYGNISRSIENFEHTEKKF